MNGWSALDRFLRTDPQDVGCEQAMEMLHVYAELVAAGEPAENATPASRRTCRRAGRAERISKGCWPRSAAKRTDHYPLLPAPMPGRSRCRSAYRRAPSDW